MFRFANPHYLYLLAALPLLAVLFLYAARNRRKRLERFSESKLLHELAPAVSTRRVRNKFILFLCAAALLIVAAARPQFGSKLKEQTRKGIEIMLAVDVSNSMLAEDFEPNRLERSKYAINRLLEGMQEDKVGLIVFAGDAYVQLPITADYVTARNFTRQISTDMVSRQGTAIGAAIDLAASSFSSESEGSRALIIITDGENHEDDAVAAARAAAEKGITLYTIGIGTPEGAPIKIGNDYLRDEKGEMVVSKLDEQTLESIALLSGGAYIRSNNKSIGLDEIIEKINRTEKREFKTMAFDEFNEQYQYLTAVALLLLIGEWLMLPHKNPLLARFNLFKNANNEE
ncbi:MAG: VWA domain-containing protein [Rikenellaceae bacterium]|nr:VWA domain-containing protein [Rikenellaceae bacterium]